MQRFEAQPENLVDVLEISEEDQKKPHRLSAEGRMHRMVSAVEGNEKFHCMGCGTRSLNNRVPGAGRGETH